MNTVVEGVKDYKEVIDRLYELSKNPELRERHKAICDPKLGYSLVSKSRVRVLDAGEMVAVRRFCETHAEKIDEGKRIVPVQGKRILDVPKRLPEEREVKKFIPYVEPSNSELDEKEFHDLLDELSRKQEELPLVEVEFPPLKIRDYLNHQKLGIRWLLTPRPNGMTGGILADEPGLGKTLQSLIASRLKGLPILVATPASTVENWSREVEMAGVENVHICSWEGLEKWTDEVLKNGKQTKIRAFTPKEGMLTQEDFIFIGDEAHNLQNVTTLRSQRTIAITNSPHCKGVFLLTGTPMANALPKNIFPLLFILKHPLALDQKNFEVRYCNGRMKSMVIKGRERWMWDIDGAKNLDELARLIAPYILLRYKRDWVNLPGKTRVIHTCKLGKDDKEVYEKELREMRERYLDRVKRQEIMESAAVQLGQLRLAASLGKVNYTAKMAQDLVKEGNQVIVFTWFKETAKRIAELLGCEVISGSVPQKKRQPIVDRFESGEYKTIVCSFGAGGTGINLIKGNWILQVERPFVPGIEEQASDRSDRIGQTREVTNVWLQAFEVDLYVDTMVEKKSAIIDLVIRGKRKTLRGMGKSANSIAKVLLSAILEED